MSKTQNYDKHDVLTTAAGQWERILLHFVPELRFSTKNGPCPMCGGKDRFRIIDPEAGAALCNQCFATGCGDGLATIQWATSKPFGDVVNEVGQFLGVSPRQKVAKKKQPENNTQKSLTKLESRSLREPLVVSWLSKCWGTTPSTIDSLTGFVGDYRTKYTTIVIAIPTWCPEDPESHVLLALDEKGFGCGRKTHNYGKSGLLFADRGAKLTFKVEGESDFFAACEKWPTVNVVTSTAGAGHVKEWMMQKIKGTKVLIIPDCDDAGLSGGYKWARMLDEAEIEWEWAQLPFPDASGKDLKDFIYEHPGGKISDCIIELDEDTYKTFSATETKSNPSGGLQLAIDNLKAYQAGGVKNLVYFNQDFYTWDGRHYKQRKLDDIEVKARDFVTRRLIQIHDELPDSDSKPDYAKDPTRVLINEVISNTRVLTRISGDNEIPCWIDDPEKSKHYISVNNGILDLTNPAEPALLAPDPNWFSLNHLPYDYIDFSQKLDWDYQPIEEEFVGFLKSVLIRREDRMAWQEWCGLSLIPEHQWCKGFMLIGEGANGKSSLIAAHKAMMGQGNYSSVGIEELDNSHSTASMLGKLINYSSDFGGLTWRSNAEGTLKQLIGGNTVFINPKCRPGYSADLPTRMVLCTNVHPKWKDQSRGMLRRWHYLHTDQSFEGANVKLGLDQTEHWLRHRSFMLWWALHGLARLFHQGEFTESEESKRTAEQYRQELNPALKFLEERYRPDPDGFVTTAVLVQEYNTWAMMNNIKKNYSSIGLGRQIARCWGIKTTRSRGERGWPLMPIQ